MNKSIPYQERLIFPLDFSTIKEAKDWISKLDDIIHFYKIGIEILTSTNYLELIEFLSKKNKKIFADFKFYDIPETVKRAIKNITKLNIYFITVHGNYHILKEAVSVKKNLKILSITALTSFDRQDLINIGVNSDLSLSDLIRIKSNEALELNCDGIVCSAKDLKSLSDEVKKKLFIVTPGIRNLNREDHSSPNNDHKRVANIEEAFKNGSDYIVMGRPITNSENPYIYAKKVLKIIEKSIL